MALDIYMQIANPVISGHSTSAVAPKQFVISSLSFGGVRPSVANATLTQITATLAMDSATDLMKSMVTGTTHDITFSIYRSGGTGAPLQEQALTLTTAHFTMIQESTTSGDNAPSLEISLAFEKIEITEFDTQTIFHFPQLVG